MAMIESKILPHCWVCNRRFSNQVPPGPALEERHHLMPQAYGGKEGPQVSLCDHHHSCLHRIAVAIKAKKAFSNFLAHEPLAFQRKLIWMASLVVKSEQATVNDANKATKVMLVLDSQQKRMLDHLKETLGFTSRAEVYHEALRKLYRNSQ